MKISVFVLKINEKPVTAIFFSEKTIPLPRARASPNTSSIPLLSLSAEMDLSNWNRFRAFGGMLNGKESYDAWTIYNVSFLTQALVKKGSNCRKNALLQILAFLEQVNECPTMYGITGIHHLEGVQCLYHSFEAKSVAQS